MVVTKKDKFIDGASGEEFNRYLKENPGASGLDIERHTTAYAQSEFDQLQSDIRGQLSNIAVATHAVSSGWPETWADTEKGVTRRGGLNSSIWPFGHSV